LKWLPAARPLHLRASAKIRVFVECRIVPVIAQLRFFLILRHFLCGPWRMAKRGEEGMLDILYRHFYGVIEIIWLVCCTGMSLEKPCGFVHPKVANIPIGRAQDTSGSPDSGGHACFSSPIFRWVEIQDTSGSAISVNCSMIRGTSR